jgi:hypothetical protein
LFLLKEYNKIKKKICLFIFYNLPVLIAMISFFVKGLLISSGRFVEIKLLESENFFDIFSAWEFVYFRALAHIEITSKAIMNIFKLRMELEYEFNLFILFKKIIKKTFIIKIFI